MAQAAKTKRIFDNRYEILSIVGRGHVSVVYHAVHLKSPSTEVALKVLVNRKDQKSSAERLRKEALAMVSSRHRYVVRLDDFHSMGDLCYLSMEYAPESDLRRYLTKLGTPLPVSQAELFLSQMAQALAFVHKVGIIHRDIKADNILVVNEKESRLADYSVAVLPGEESSLEELQTGVGTMAYMAPEVLEGKSYEPSSDLYALGVTFYELLTGKHPFENAPLSQQLDIRREGGFPHILDLAPQVPRYLTDIIMRALRYDKALRFSSAEEMVALLAAGAAAEPTPMPKLAAPTPLKKPVLAEPVSKPEVKISKPVTAPIPESLPAPGNGPSTSGIRKTRYAQKIEQMKKERDEGATHSEPSAVNTQVTQRIEPPAAAPVSANEDTTRIDHPVKVPESKPPQEEKAESSGRVHRRQRGRTPTEKIDQSIVDQIRAARAQEPERPPETPVPRPETAQTHPPPAEGAHEIVRRPLPWKPLIAAFAVMALVYYWRFSGPSEQLPTPIQTVQEPSAVATVPEKDLLIPSVVETTFNFPTLPAGVYHGVLQGFISQREAPLTLLSIPGKRLLVVLIGIPGMVPALIDLEAWQKRADESGESQALRIAANGQVLEFSGKQIDDSLQGSFVNLVTGDEGTWFVRPIRGGEKK